MLIGIGPHSAISRRSARTRNASASAFVIASSAVVPYAMTPGNLSLFNNSVFYHENWLSHDPFAVQYWCSIFRRSTKGLKYKGNIEIPLFSEEWEAQIF
jgi:hypothetical protein